MGAVGGWCLKLLRRRNKELGISANNAPVPQRLARAAERENRNAPEDISEYLHPKGLV